MTRDNPGGEYVVWPTDLGYLNFGRIDPTQENDFVIKQRLQSEAKTTVRPGYLPPDPNVPTDSGTVFAATDDGNVLAIRDENGVSRWQFTTGEPIVQSPAPIEDRVYVATEQGGMYCLDSATGRNLWRSPSVTQFVAASRSRVYGRDSLGHLLVLNAGSGEPQGGSRRAADNPPAGQHGHRPDLHDRRRRADSMPPRGEPDQAHPLEP